MNTAHAPILGQIAALSDPARSRMLLLLDSQELTVSELCAVLQMPQSSVSRHLKALADESWVTSRRDGTSRYYTMAAEELDAASRQLWPLVRTQVANTRAAEQDRRRSDGVMAERRAKSKEFFATAAGQWDHLREDLFGDTFYLWAVLGLIDPGLVVGDLGCGTGLLSQTVAPYVRQVIAVDASRDMLDAAKRRLDGRKNVDFRQGELETLPVADTELDVAMLSLVLHYSPDPARALGEVARVTKPNGRVLIVDMLPHDREEYTQQMGHVWLGFSEKQIAKLLAAAGFARVTVHALPVDRQAKGPTLFAATATRQ